MCRHEAWAHPFWCGDSYAAAGRTVSSLFFDHLEVILKQQPILRKRQAQLPVADAPQAQLLDQIELGLNGAGILEPYRMLPPFVIGVIEMRRLGSIVILNGCIPVPGQINGRLRTERFGILPPATKGSVQS